MVNTNYYKMIENFIFITSGILGLTITFIISRQKTHRTINMYLIFAFGLISFRFLFEVFFSHYKFVLPRLSITPFFALAFPMFYLYFLNLVNDSKKIKNKELVHFIFPIVLGCVNLLNNQFDFLGIHSTKLLTSIFIFYSIFYTTNIFLLLKNSVWNRNSKIIFINKHNTIIRNWTIFLFLIIIMSVARLLIFLFLDLINNGYSGGKNKLWISGLFFIILFIKILSTPEILYGYNALYKKIQEQKKSNFVLNEIWILSQKKRINNQQDFLLQDKINANLEKYVTNIERLALIERGFRNQKITTTEVAKKLDIPKSHLKYIFKYHSKISFTEFKKLIKIHDSLHLIESGYLKLNTLEGLAIKVGFASYNPFFTSFKGITGSTPQAYNKEIKGYKD